MAASSAWLFSAFALFVGFSMGLVASEPASPREGANTERAFVRGDANQDGYVTLSDVYAVLRFLYAQSPLACLDAADVDDDGQITRIDAFALIGALFFGHTSVLKPYPAPGLDPTPDGLGCSSGTSGIGASPEAGGGGSDDAAGTAGGFVDDGPSVDCVDPAGGAEIDFLHFRGALLLAPGETGVRVPIYMTTAGDVEGLSISLYAPPDLVRLESLDLSQNFLSSSGLKPGWVRTFDLQRDAGYLAGTLALSLGSDLTTMPAVQDAILGYVELSALPDAPVGTRTALKFRATPARGGYLPIRNELCRKGVPQARRLCGLSIEIVDAREVFIRADANRDRRVNLADAVTILGYLFASVSEQAFLPCPDAADVDDDGRITLTDAVHIAFYLFARGPAPVPPFPNAGRDWSGDDPLRCEE